MDWSHIRYFSGLNVISIRQKSHFQSRPWADWYFNHWSVFLVWSWSQSQGWIFCPKFKTCPRWYIKILDFGKNIHPCDWDHDQTRNTLQWLKYQSAQGLDRKRNFCLIAITFRPEEYLIRLLWFNKCTSDKCKKDDCCKVVMMQHNVKSRFLTNVAVEVCRNDWCGINQRSIECC